MNQNKFSILALCGSLRADSFNSALLRNLPEIASERLTFTFAPPLDLPIYNDDDRLAGKIPPRVLELKDQIAAADGLMIASPEYNHSVASPLKNAIDWLSKLEDQPFKRKKIALLSAATGLLGGSRAQYHLRQILNALEARVLSKPEVFVNFSRKKFAAGALQDSTTREMVATQLKAFEAFLSEAA